MSAISIVTPAGVITGLSNPELLVVLGLLALVAEAQKKDGFGPNGEIIKALTAAINDIKNGPGENNDLRKVLENAWKDMSQGWGENNDIRKSLEGLGIRF